MRTTKPGAKSNHISEETAIAAMLNLYYKKEGIGFSRAEAPLMADLVARYKNKGYLSPPQLNDVRRVVRRYLSVLELAAPKPATPEPAPIQCAKLAEIDKRYNNTLAIFIEQQNPTITNELRKMPGRAFDKKENCWKVRMSLELVEQLRDWGYTFGPRLERWYNTVTGLPTGNEKLKFRLLKRTLLSFQEFGVRFLRAKGGRAIVADDMGLGKTTEVLAWLDTEDDAWPSLVVCPSSVKYNWNRETRNVLGKAPKVRILEGQKPNGTLSDYDIVIVNYDILKFWKKLILKNKFRTIILDEGHMLKNLSSQRTKASLAIADKCPYVLWCSGTPIEQNNMELWTCLKTVAPGMFSTKNDFGMEFGGPYRNGNMWAFSGSSNSKKLNRLLTSTVMLRRRKKDVVKDMPAKSYQVISIEMPKKVAKEYHDAENEFLTWVRKNLGTRAHNRAARAEQITKLNYLAQIAWKGKAEAVKEWVENFLHTGNKLVTFHTYTASVKYLMEAFPNESVSIVGGMGSQKKLETVQAFSNSQQIKLCHANIVAAGTGTDGLQNDCSDAAFMGFLWNPMVHTQAEDRLHRMGQKLPVTIWWFVCVNTVEEARMLVLDAKKGNVVETLDGEELPKTEILEEVMKRMRKRHAPSKGD